MAEPNIIERLQQFKKGCLRERMQQPYIYTASREEQRALLDWLQNAVDDGQWKSHNKTPLPDIPNLLGWFDGVYVVAETRIDTDEV